MEKESLPQDISLFGNYDIYIYIYIYYIYIYKVYLQTYGLYLQVSWYWLFGKNSITVKVVVLLNVFLAIAVDNLTMTADEKESLKEEEKAEEEHMEEIRSKYSPGGYGFIFKFFI